MKHKGFIAFFIFLMIPLVLFGGGKGEKPVVSQGPVELTYFQILGPRAAATMKSYSEMYQFQVLEKNFNVKFKFLHPPAGQEIEQFNLMIASKDLPDFISYNYGNIPGGPGTLISERIIIKLNDVFQKYAPNVSKILNENPDAAREVMLDDGTYYMFPFLRLATNVRLNGGPSIRQDWLDRLGLKKPETIEEWYTVLKAFKEKDANGNGDPNDELPLVSLGDEVFRQVFTAAWGIRMDFFIGNDKKVRWGPIEPAYRDFLATMAKWYKEGLIDPDYITTDNRNLDAKVLGNKAGALFAWMNGSIGRYNSLKKNDPSFNLVGTIWPKTKEGISYNINYQSARLGDGQGVTITTKNKQVELSAKLLDYAYGEEGNLLVNFGKLGETYVIENGKIKFTDLVLKNPKGLSPTNALTMYCMGSSGTGGAFVQDPRYATLLREAIPQQVASEKVWALSQFGLVPPPIQPSEADSSRLSKIMNEVNTYVSEMTNKIIMGVEPIAKFDEFVQIQERMGIREALAIQQKAYDAYMTRKVR
ncbi:MAG: extracellular solute-binding protein [Bacteroidales bacterium]